MSNKKLEEINALIDAGFFDDALIKSEELLLVTATEVNIQKKAIFLYNIAGFFIDIGHLSNNHKVCQKGFDLLTINEVDILNVIPKSEYYYSLANAKSNLISFVYGEDVNFNNIEELIDLKNLYWRAFRENKNDEKINLQIRVNLANSLKRQFRISESLRYYDEVISINDSIFQAYINRSESLKILNSISNTYSAKLINEIVNGYSAAAESKHIPPQFVQYYLHEKEKNISIIKSLGFSYDDSNDDEGTKAEYEKLSDYRKYCINKKLTLSEHGLYCSCIGAARDNLTIPLTHNTIGGNFVPKMELVLNRIKSEFSLARKNYYDFYHLANSSEQNYEDCYTDLLNNEVLGIAIEKMRLSFRICFGILDKIAVAICELYQIENKGNIYFHNFWRLDDGNNRSKFEKIKNPGLLALYSIATDLNVNKNGEWSCFKDWRNSLEHGLFIICDDNECETDPFSSFVFNTNIVKIKLSDFLAFIDELLQLTRSAIFSFVFCVRHYAMEIKDNGQAVTLQRKDE